MINPVTEVQAFVRAALVDPVPRDHTEPDAAFRRRRVVVVVTLLVGAAVLTWALRIEPGDSLFYVATLALAAVWAVGAVASGPLHLGRARTRSGGLRGRAVVQSLALGLLLLALFLIGSVVVARIPFLRDPVDDLLDYAQFGSLALVAVITAINGMAGSSTSGVRCTPASDAATRSWSPRSSTLSSSPRAASRCWSWPPRWSAWSWAFSAG